MMPRAPCTRHAHGYSGLLTRLPDMSGSSIRFRLISGLERTRTLIERHPCVVRWLLVGVGCTCGVHRLGNRIDGIAQRLTASVE